MHYFKRNIGDYHKKAGRLTMLQHGAYTLLLDSCYDREQFPTIEEAIDWVWASSDPEIEAVKFVLNKFFVNKNDTFIQYRIQDELERYHKNANTNQRIAMERETKRREKRTKREQVVNEAPPNQEPLTNNHKPITTNQEPSLKDIQASKLADSLIRIFNHWCLSMNKNNRTQFTANRKTCVTARLKDGYSEDDIICAITSSAKSPYHMGQNDTGTIYDDLTLICRNGEKLEGFINNAGRSPIKQQTKQQSISDKNREAMQAFLSQGEQHGN